MNYEQLKQNDLVICLNENIGFLSIDKIVILDGNKITINGASFLSNFDEPLYIDNIPLSLSDISGYEYFYVQDFLDGKLKLNNTEKIKQLYFFYIKYDVVEARKYKLRLLNEENL